MTADWQLIYEGYDPEEELLRETLCTLGNGVFATRGAAEWATDDGTHYPGTYLAGGYNRLTSVVGGRDVVNEDLVNFPNWLGLTFRPAEGHELGDPASELSDYRQELDLRRGILRRAFAVRDSAGRETRVSSRRFVHMANPHLCAVEMEIVPLNWSGDVTIRSILDGTVTNNGVPRYRELRGDHLTAAETGEDAGIIWLSARTKQSALGVALAARTRIASGEIEGPTSSAVRSDEATIEGAFEVEARAGCPITIEKVVSLRTTRDLAFGDLVEDAVLNARRASSFDELAASHASAWEALWDRYDIEVDVTPDAEIEPHSIQLILRPVSYTHLTLPTN